MVALTVTFALQENTRAGGRTESSRQQYEISRNKRGRGKRTQHKLLTQGMVFSCAAMLLEDKNIFSTQQTSNKNLLLTCTYSMLKCACRTRHIDDHL